MWEILPGIEFASTALVGFNLQPAHCLYLARRYNLLDWVPAPIRILLSAPLERYRDYTGTDGNKNNLDFELYMIIATAKESIAVERKRLGSFPPFPKDFDNEPFCAQHATCKKIWSEKWFYVILRRIHHPVDPLPLSLVPNALEELEHRGMNPECKRSILTWLTGSCNQIQTEENIIQATIAEVCTLFK
jgi:hypothetical protein